MATQSTHSETAPTVAIKSISDATKRLVDNRLKIADIDAELNGGTLVKVGEIIGKSLYIRVNHNDRDRATYEIDYVQSILRGAFNPPAEKQVLTVEEYARKQRVSVVTVRRWIKSGKLSAYKVGKNYRINSHAQVTDLPTEGYTPPQGDSEAQTKAHTSKGGLDEI